MFDISVLAFCLLFMQKSLDGITSLRFVPVVQHSQLVLYGIPASPPTTDDHKLSHFLNAEAIRNFHIPKRRPPASSPSSALLFSSPLPSQDSSDAVQRSCCLRRFHAGLPSNPHSLTFTLSTSQGEQWSSNNLEGQRSMMFVFIVIVLQHLDWLTGNILLYCYSQQFD